MEEQLRFALWLRKAAGATAMFDRAPAGLADLSIYWASSGWDLNLLLDAEAPVETLSSFVERNPGIADVALVKYSLAVRLARENRYREASDLFETLNANRRASRMRELEALYEAASREDAGQHRLESKYHLAEFIAANPEQLYFNDRLWRGYQRYAFQASTDSRLNRAERDELIQKERKLKDDQEERWRAYLVLQDVLRDSSDRELRRRATTLALRCLLGMNERFGREEEIRKATAVLSRELRQAR